MMYDGPGVRNVLISAFGLWVDLLDPHRTFLLKA